MRGRAPLFVAVVLVAWGCTPGGGAGGQTQTPSVTPSLTLPPVPTRSAPDRPSQKPTTGIVVYEISDGQDPRPVDVTYTGKSGEEVKVSRAIPGSWSQGGFWPVGTAISLSATTDDGGDRRFSCVIAVNGTRYTSRAEARSVNNVIVGWDCRAGPIVVESVV